MQETDFEIYRDGELDAAFRRSRHMAQMRKMIGKSAVAMLKPLGAGLGEMFNEWDLAAYDQRHHTHLLADYRAKRRAASTARFAASHGL